MIAECRDPVSRPKGAERRTRSSLKYSPRIALLAPSHIVRRAGCHDAAVAALLCRDRLQLENLGIFARRLQVAGFERFADALQLSHVLE